MSEKKVENENENEKKQEIDNEETPWVKAASKRSGRTPKEILEEAQQLGMI